jgi:hypothetical protein
MYLCVASAKWSNRSIGSRCSLVNHQPPQETAFIRSHKTVFCLHPVPSKEQISVYRPSSGINHCYQKRGTKHQATATNGMTEQEYMRTQQHNFLSCVIIPCNPSSRQYLLQVNKFTSPHCNHSFPRNNKKLSFHLLFKKLKI